MSLPLVYIGDSMVDLDYGQVIATTLKKISIQNPIDRNINYTDSFSAKWTENNCRLFGFAYDQNSNSSIPYNLRECKIVQDGRVIMDSALLFIKNPDQKKFTLSIVENSYGFFNFIENKLLSEVNPIEPTPFTASYIDSIRGATSGVIPAVLNYGRSGPIFQIDYFLPSFYYHSILTAIFESSGLQISGSILTDSRFKELIVPFPGDEFLYRESFVSPLRMQATSLSNQDIEALITGVTLEVNWDIVNYGSEYFHDDRYYQFPFEVNATISATLLLSSIVYNDGSELLIKLRKYIGGVGGGVDLDSVSITGPSGSVELTYTGDFGVDDLIEVEIFSDAPSTGIFGTITVLKFDVAPNRIPNRDKVFWNELWGDTKCIDFVKDFFVRFFIVHKQAEGTLYFKTIDEICSDRAGAIDWSEKITKTNEPIDLNPNYAQINNFKYSGDETIGVGSIDIDNSVIELSKDIYTSPFQSSLTEWNNGFNCATIPAFDDGSDGIDDFKDAPGLRLLTVRNRSNEGGVTFNVTPRLDYKIGYFVDSVQVKDTGWQYFIDQFYPKFRYALQRSKIIDKNFLLTAEDISKFDFFYMVWDGKGYYLVDIIDKFIDGKATKVKVFKIV